MNEKKIFELDIERPYSYAEKLSPLERMLYEDGHYQKGKFYLLRKNVETKPAYLGLGSLARRFACSLKEAERFRDSFEALDATPEMVNVFARWTRRSGKDKALDYFSGLGKELKNVEKISEEDALSLEQRLQSDESFGAFSYQPLRGSKEAVPWEMRQPPRYRALLKQIAQTPYEKLSSLGNDLYANDSMTREQRRVAFDHYQRRKGALMQDLRRKASPQACTLLERIKDAEDSEVPGLGVYLYQAQQGLAPLEEKPREKEWGLIWLDYRVRKQNMAP